MHCNLVMLLQKLTLGAQFHQKLIFFHWNDNVWLKIDIADWQKVIPAHWIEMLNLVWKLFLMISCLDMIFFHTTGLLRHQGFQENWKKANKGRKGQIKGQGVKNAIFSYFLVNLASFGVNKAEISIFLNLKAIKAKKAAIVAWNGNLQRRLFTEPKLLFWHSEGLL